MKPDRTPVSGFLIIKLSFMEELMSEIWGDVGASREKMNGDCGQRRGSAKPPGRKFWLGFPGGSDSKESACNVGELGSIPGLGRSPGEENSNSF